VHARAGWRGNPEFDAAVDHAVKVSTQRLAASTAEVGSPDHYPTYGTHDLKWQLRSSKDWTSGFYRKN